MGFHELVLSKKVVKNADFEFFSLTQAHLELWFCIEKVNIKNPKTSRDGKFNCSDLDVFENANLFFIFLNHNSKNEKIAFDDTILF